jgi:hypothetical protein
MPTFDRTTIVRGPCKITYDGATFYSKAGVVLTTTNATFDKETDAYGIVTKSKTDFTMLVEFEPVGEIESLTVLFPHGNTAMGASIYGATDKPLVIVSADKTYTILNAQITQMPSIRCTANQTAFGSVQFTGLLKINGDPENVEDYFTTGTGGSIGSAFNPALMITAPYTATLGALDPFMSSEGFEISFDLALNPVTVDGIGTVDMTMGNLGANITCVPVGIDQLDFDTFFDTLSAGDDLTSSTLDISTSTVGGLNFDCAAVQITELQRNFSAADNRLGTLTMSAKRTFNAGAQVALFTVAAVTSP